MPRARQVTTNDALRILAAYDTSGPEIFLAFREGRRGELAIGASSCPRQTERRAASRA